MKKLLLTIGLAVSLVSVTKAQTNSSSGFNSLLDHATNITGVAYGSYFLNNHRVGGGMLALYKLNNTFSIGAGADWAGMWRSVSGDVTINHTWMLNSKLSLDTYGIVAALTSLGGAGSDNGTFATAEGGGAQLRYQFSNSLNIGIGSAYIQRQNCGDFSNGSILGVASINLSF